MKMRHVVTNNGLWRIKCNQRCARVLDSAGELTDKIAISLSDSVGWRHSLNSNPEETKALSTKNFREFASRIEDAGAPLKRHWLALILKDHNSSLRGCFRRRKRP